MYVSRQVKLSLMKGRHCLTLLLKLSSWQHYMLKIITSTWQVTSSHFSDLWLIFVLWSVFVKLFLAILHEFSTYPFLSPFTLSPVFKCCVFSFLLNKPFLFSTNHTCHFLRMLFFLPGQGRNIHCNSIQFILLEWINDCTLKFSSKVPYVHLGEGGLHSHFLNLDIHLLQSHIKSVWSLLRKQS